MDIIKQMRQKARSDLKTIVLPEYKDSRIVEAAGIVEKEGLASENMVFTAPATNM